MQERIDLISEIIDKYGTIGFQRGVLSCCATERLPEAHAAACRSRAKSSFSLSTQVSKSVSNERLSATHTGTRGEGDTQATERGVPGAVYLLSFTVPTIGFRLPHAPTRHPTHVHILPLPTEPWE